MSESIRQQVNEWYEKMNTIFNPSSFDLQPEMMKIQKEVENLQKKCKHHFVNGKCEFCDMEENE